MASGSQKMGNHSHSAMYGIGFIGPLVYFIQTATGFWMGVVGVLKAFFWPGFLVYYLLEFLKV